MIGQYIHSFRLKDTLLFKDVEFVIPKGVTTIYGLNRMSGRKSTQANGAGKSSLFSSIGETIYEEPIVGLKEDTLSQGHREVTMKIGDKTVTIQRKNTKMEILVNKKAKKFRTKALAREWLRKHVPLTQSEFNTYAFLDARVPHPLVMGSSTERKKFFNEAFGLNKIDVERKLFEAELTKLKRVREAYNELYAVFEADREKALGKEKRLSLEAKVKAYEEELEDLNRKNLKLQGISQLLAFEAAAKAQIGAYLKLCHGEVGAEECNQLYEDIKKNLKENKQKLEDAIEWAQYQRDTAHYAEAIKDLSEEAAAYLGKWGTKDALRKCREASDEYPDALKAYEYAQADADNKPKRPDEVEKPNTPRKQARADLEALEHQYEHAKKFKRGTCSTCGQSVEVKDPEKLKAKITKLEWVIDAWDKYIAYEAALAKYKEDKSQYKKAVAELPDREKRVKHLNRLRKIGKEIRDIPRKPKKFEGRKLEVSVCQRMVDEDKSQLQLLDFIQPNIENIVELQKLTEKQRNAATIAPRLQKRINEVHEKLSKLKARLEVNKELTKSLKKLKARLVEMRGQLENEEALKLLVEAYSDKSIKKMAVKAISNRLMAEVNKYARLIFPEDYEFDLVWDKSKIKLLVYRKYKKEGKKKNSILSSDVRKLSGAESKLFTFILVLAMLTFVPARKRSNVLILDEPSANFSAETTESFKRLIPILNKVIPSIIIITPRTDERYEGANEYTVVKQNGEAKIVAGHPSQIK